MYGHIYKITNNVNGKIYIGKTVKDINVRFREHLTTSDRYHYNVVNNIKQKQSLLYPAIYKYGKDNFSIECIDTANDKYELNQKEIYWIAVLQANDRSIGYNIAPGGEGGPLFSGHKHSQHVKDEASKRLKGVPQDPDFVKKRTEPLCIKIQCLNSGEVYRSRLDISTILGSGVLYAIDNKIKYNGNFYIELPKELPLGYDNDTLKSLIIEYEQYNKLFYEDKHRRMSEASANSAKIRTIQVMSDITSDLNANLDLNTIINLWQDGYTFSYLQQYYGFDKKYIYKLKRYVEYNSIKRIASTYKRPNNSDISRRRKVGATLQLNHKIKKEKWFNDFKNFESFTQEYLSGCKKDYLMSKYNMDRPCYWDWITDYFKSQGVDVRNRTKKRRKRDKSDNEIIK